MSRDYRMPDGTATKDADTMCDAWKELQAPFLTLGYVGYGFDPMVSVCKMSAAGQMGHILTMTVEQARELGALIRERDELRRQRNATSVASGNDSTRSASCPKASSGAATDSHQS